MKENTQKLLCWLYDEPADGVATAPYSITYVLLRQLLSDLTAGGRRSLVRYLSDQHLIRAERLGKETYISITEYGREALRAELPAFRSNRQDWEGQWSCLTFCEAPESDAGFRYLRQLLLDHQAFALSRGVYLYPGSFPAEVLQTLHNLYVGAVVVFVVNEWQFGDERRIINENYMLSDVAEVLSGISNEINQLLIDLKQQKELTDSNQQRIFSVFDRLYDVLRQDPGIIHHYFPQVPTSIDLLNQLRQLHSHLNP